MARTTLRKFKFLVPPAVMGTSGGRMPGGFIELIKAVRQVTGLGLKEAKDVCDAGKIGWTEIRTTLAGAQHLLTVGATVKTSMGVLVKGAVKPTAFTQPSAPAVPAPRGCIPAGPVATGCLEDAIARAHNDRRAELPRTRIVLGEGETLVVELEGTDGEFVIAYDKKRMELRVEADLADSTGRQGVIYCERFGDVASDVEEVPGD